MMVDAVTVRAFDANAPIDENEKQDTRIWSSEGWLDCEAIDGATYVSAEVGEAGHNGRLVEFLESNDLDAYAQWLVLTDGSLVAVQSIDLCDHGVLELVFRLVIPSKTAVTRTLMSGLNSRRNVMVNVRTLKQSVETFTHKDSHSLRGVVTGLAVSLPQSL